jgi:hypothetical protein
MIFRPAAVWCSTSQCTFVTRGQVASTCGSRLRSASDLTDLATPVPRTQSVHHPQSCRVPRQRRHPSQRDPPRPMGCGLFYAERKPARQTGSESPRRFGSRVPRQHRVNVGWPIRLKGGRIDARWQQSLLAKAVLRYKTLESRRNLGGVEPDAEIMPACDSMTQPFPQRMPLERLGGHNAVDIKRRSRGPTPSG